MNKKGFTILETMVSVGIFSVLMIIVFSCWTEFQKVSLKNEGKQDTNVTFVNVYRNVDKIVSSSSIQLFRDYSNTYLGLGHEDLRWFAFLISRNNHQLDGTPVYQKRSDTPSDVLVYNTCVVYLLNTPNDNCTGGFNSCPHKSLRRYVFETTQPLYFNGDQKKVVKTIFTHNILPNQVAPILNGSSSIPFSVIENNIVDLKIHRESDKIRFFLRIMRINDAERHFEIGTEQLTDLNSIEEFTIPNTNKAKKYIENLSWISIPSNTISIPSNT